MIPRRFLCGVLVPLVFACAPEPAPLRVPGPTTAMPPKASVISAGAGVRNVVVADPRSNVLSFRVAFSSGSADDPPGKEGITELLANMVTEGGTTELTYAELTKKFFPLATRIVANVDRDETVFVAEIAKPTLASFYPLFRDVLLTPRLDEETFSRLRARALSDLVNDLRGANDEELGKEALQALIYEGHPYGHPTVGTEKGLAGITLEDVRSHRARVFCRERVTIGLAGAVSDELSKQLSIDLASLPACAKPGEPVSLAKPKSREGLNVLLVDKPTAEATAISIGFPTELNRSRPEYPTVLFFTNYLGLHRQSAGRLFQTLREVRGLNYGDYAYSEFFEQDGESRHERPNIVRKGQMVSIWLRPTKPKNALFALKGALFVYRRLLERGISQDEIKRYAQFLTRYIGLEQQTESRRLGFAMDDAAYGLKEDQVRRFRNAWTALDENQIRTATRQWLTPTNLSVAIVAPDAKVLAQALLRDVAPMPIYDAPKPPEVLAEDKEIAREPLALSPDRIRIVNVGEIFR